jgi:hypothetical protein
MAKLNPSLSFELAVSGADCVGMKTKLPREFPRTWQALTCGQIVAEDPENNLRYELFADGNVAAAGEPELHGASS